MGRPKGTVLSQETKDAIADSMRARYARIRELLELDKLSNDELVTLTEEESEQEAV